MFTSMSDDPDWSPRIAMFGDMGVENAQSLPRIQREAQHQKYDAIIHVGDFGYDLVSVSLYLLMPKGTSCQ